MRFFLLVCLTFLLSTTSSIAQATFENPLPIQFPASLFTVATADLNEDGRPDLIVGGNPIGDESGKIYILINIGNAQFSPSQAYQIGTRPSQLIARYVQNFTITDMNNDGHLDVVVGHNGSRDPYHSFSPLLVTILFGNGNGTLQPSDSLLFQNFSESIMVSEVRVIDLNNDGLKDLVVGCDTGRYIGQVYLVKNMGGGSFQTMGPRAVLGSVIGMDVADFNHDSNVDVAFASREGMTLWFSNGNFFFPTGSLVQYREDLGEMVVSDFNGDGRSDFAVADFNSMRLRILIHRRSGWPKFPVNVFYKATRVFPDSMKGRDIIGDGKQDIILTDGHTGGIEIFYGIGNGEFQPAASVVANTPASDIAFADFDGNGKLDIITANYNETSPVQAQLFLQNASASTRIR